MSLLCDSSVPKKRYKGSPSNWKRHKNRALRLKGEAYQTIKGKNIAARPMKPPPCHNRSKHQCCSKIPETTRLKINTEFRNLKSVQQQREFFVKHVKKEAPNRKTVPGESRKSYTKKYFLTVNFEQIKVCREFFLTTLGISEGIVRGALRKLSSTGILESEKRGGNKKPEVTEEDSAIIKHHILSFPAVESHYCRKDSEFRYLDSNLTIRKMYRLYVNQCLEENKKNLKFESYRKIFKTYKLKFHVPKKDSCKTCVVYKEKTENEKVESRNEYEKHLNRKEAARTRRNEDKAAAIENKDTTLSFNFDLQAVLQTPKGAAGPFFYVRKLAVYNFTIYNLGNSDADCFLWDETEGKRGSCEISSCLFKYLMGKTGIKHVRMMSDSCGGQQKNFNFSLMCLKAVNSHPTLEIIDHVYFEPGHSQMECDSIHSKIEQKSKNVPVYTPDGWAQLIRAARINPRPFNVTTLLCDDFLNFNASQCQIVFLKKNIGAKTQEELDVVKEPKFKDCVWFQYRKSETSKVFAKLDYNDTDFFELNVKAKRGRVNRASVAAYKTRISVSSPKKRDLLQLCSQSLIPRVYHSFFEKLPSSENQRDRLAEPDNSEESE